MKEERHQEGQEVGWETFSSLSQIFLLRSPDDSLNFGHSRQERLLNLLRESSRLTSRGRSYGTEKRVSNTKGEQGREGAGGTCGSRCGIGSQNLWLTFSE
jgi:hypothetical protein